MKRVFAKYSKDKEPVMKYIYKFAELEDQITLSTLNRDFRDMYHALGFQHLYPIMVRRKWTLQRILNAYITYHLYLPKQGTEQWHKYRITTIGGSELATVLGENKYQKLKDFIGNKLGIEKYKFSGNTATRWGKMFEPVFRMFVSSIFSTSIYETGSIPGYRTGFNAQNPNGIVLQSYSPDGLGITNLETVRKFIDISSSTYLGESASDDPRFHNLTLRSRRVITLFEFKCPLRAVLTGNVPENYISQPLAGLCTIPIAKLAIFMQGVFRRCRTDDFHISPIYDNIFHEIPRGGVVSMVPDPVVMGFVGIYQSGEGFRVKSAKGVDPVPVHSIDSILEHYNEIISRPHSKYYGIKASATTVVSIAKLLEMLCSDPNIGWEIYVSLLPESKREKISSSQVVKQAFYQTYTTSDAELLEKIKRLSVGDDLCQTKEHFENLLESVVDGGSAEIYYPEGMYHADPEMDMYFDQNIPANYVGDLSDRSPVRWLYNNLRDFEKFCMEGNHKPIGYIPWKMFEYTAIPVYKQDDYITKNLPKIEYAHSIINNIRSKSEKANFDDELEKLFPTRGGGGSSFTAQRRKNSPETKNKQSGEDLETYGDLTDYFSGI